MLNTDEKCHYEVHNRNYENGMDTVHLHSCKCYPEAAGKVDVVGRDCLL